MKTLMTLLLASVLVGCGGATNGGVAESGDPQSALEQYDEEVAPILEQVEILGASYASVQGKNYTTDQKMFRVVSKDVPEWTVLSDEAAAIRSEDDAVDEAHDVLVDALRANQRGLTLILNALETQDYEGIANANDALAESVDLFADYEAAMNEVRAD